MLHRNIPAFELRAPPSQLILIVPTRINSNSIHLNRVRTACTRRKTLIESFSSLNTEEYKI